MISKLQTRPFPSSSGEQPASYIDHLMNGLGMADIHETRRWRAWKIELQWLFGNVFGLQLTFTPKRLHSKHEYHIMIIVKSIARHCGNLPLLWSMFDGKFSTVLDTIFVCVVGLSIFFISEPNRTLLRSEVIRIVLTYLQCICKSVPLIDYNAHRRI